jgi:drug/metabolite transporter (DMT)-like permease
VTQTLSSARRSLQRRDDIHVIAAIVAVTAWGVGPIFNKAVSVGTPSIVFYRMLLGVPMMVAMAYLTGGGLTRDLMRRTALPGVLFAFSFLSGFASLRMTSIANATLITTLQPVLVLFVAPKMFGEKIRLKQLGLSSVSMVGVLTVVLAAASTSGAHISGDLLAVLNVVIWTGYFVLAKKRRVDGMHSWSFLAAIFIWSSLVILPYGLIVSNDLGKVTQFDWVMLVGMSVIPGIVGHGLMTWSQSHLDVTLASILGLLSPVVSTGLAWIIFSQSLTGLQMLGAVVVLGSLTLLVREQRAFSLPVLERET